MFTFRLTSGSVRYSCMNPCEKPIDLHISEKAYYDTDFARMSVFYVVYLTNQNFQCILKSC